jgi:2OG-Fe(II) oxygenase superfamily/AhpC/TSA family
MPLSKQPGSERAMHPSNFHRGDPAPWFVFRSNEQQTYRFDAIAGRYVVLCFLGTARDDAVSAALRVALTERRALFDDANACLCCVSADPDDERLGRLTASVGVRIIWDFDRAISRLYGAAGDDDPLRYTGFWLVLDPMLRVLRTAPLRDASEIMAFVAALPPAGSHAGAALPAPILVLPRLFEPQLCRHLIGLYQTDGGAESGFMLDVDGLTVAFQDPAFKRRRDHEIRDEPTRIAMRERIERRLLPEIWKAFQFNATRIERYIVACYDAAVGGHFMAHRDNTLSGTAHRRFAVTINLNDDYDGGDLCFPEFGSRRYRGPVGGAIVFSCALMHQVSPVTRGLRYATLPFLYNEAVPAPATNIAPP